MAKSSPFDSVKLSLSKLKYQKVVLTNADYKMATRILESSRLNESVEKLFTAEVVRKFKPSPEVYNIVPAFYNVKPSEVCLVSSNAWDVDGALSAGLKAVYLERKGKPLENLTGL